MSSKVNGAKVKRFLPLLLLSVLVAGCAGNPKITEDQLKYVSNVDMNSITMSDEAQTDILIFRKGSIACLQYGDLEDYHLLLGVDTKGWMALIDEKKCAVSTAELYAFVVQKLSDPITRTLFYQVSLWDGGTGIIQAWTYSGNLFTRRLK